MQNTQILHPFSLLVKTDRSKTSLRKQILHNTLPCDRITTKGVITMLQLNTSSLYPVLRDFYTLTNLRIVIFDTQFHELMAYPDERVGFCDLLRKHPAGEAACHKSDQESCSSVWKGSFLYWIFFLYALAEMPVTCLKMREKWL